MKLLYTLAAIWGVFGLLLNMFLIWRVKRTTQKVVLFLISGPLVWFITPIIMFFDLISEKVVLPVYNWLTKE
jgi:hypothetical protein